MRATFMREALVAVRTPAFAVALGTDVGLLALFLATWSGRTVPALAGANLYEQLMIVQWALLLLILPWTAVRVMAPERDDDFVRLAALVGLPPSGLLLARLSASCTALILIVAAGMPVAVLAQKMSAVPVARVGLDELGLLACPLSAAAAAMSARLASRHRLTAWVVSSGAVLAVFAACQQLSSSGALSAVAFGLCAFITATVLVTRGERSLRYLREQPR